MFLMLNNTAIMKIANTIEFETSNSFLSKSVDLILELFIYVKVLQFLKNIDVCLIILIGIFRL